MFIFFTFRQLLKIDEKQLSTTGMQLNKHANQTPKKNSCCR